MRDDLQRLSPAPSQVSQRLEAPSNPDSRNPNTNPFDVRVAEPSSRFQRFQQPQGLFTIDHPDNWKAYAAESGYAVSMAPDGGVVDTGGGQQAMLYGVIVNHYEPFENETDRQRASRERHYAPFEDTDRWLGSLSDARDDLVRQLIRSNSYLSIEAGSARREPVGGASSLSVVLSGRSPVTGWEERVTVVTRGLSDGHVIYALCIVPGSGYDSMALTFAHMLRTLNVDDDSIHHATEESQDLGS